MVNKSLNRSDHYVSRTYLKQFTSIPKHVFAYRKKEQLEKDMPIGSICIAKDGDVCRNLENIFALREVLSNLEPVWNDFIESVKTHKIIEVDSSLPKVEGLTFLSRVSLYIAYLRCLSPTMVALGQEQYERILNDHLIKMLGQSSNTQLDSIAKQALVDGKIKVRVDDEAYFKSRSVGCLGRLGNLIYYWNWEILVNTTRTKFITSDTPCILPAWLSKTCLTSGSLVNRKPDPIYLPLTPEHALIIRPVFGQRLIYKKIKEKHVMEYNKEIVKSASDIVISNKYDPGISKLVNKYREYYSGLEFKTMPFSQGKAITMKQKNILKKTLTTV